MLRADRHTVSLAEDLFVLSDAQDKSAEFLEGLDLELQDPEPFEDWLRMMRGRVPAEDYAGKAKVGHAQSRRASHPAMRERVALGLLISVLSGANRDDLIRADHFVDDAVMFLTHVTMIDIHDFRQSESLSFPFPMHSGTGPTHWLQSIVERRSTATLVRLRLTEAATRRLIWISDPVQIQDSGATDKAIQLGELVADRLRANPVLAETPDLFPLTALAALFSLDAGLIARTEQQLTRAYQAGGSPIFECIRAFAQVFKVHEGFGALSELGVGELTRLIAGIPVSDPLLPLCKSLVGYALHMLHAENDLAFHLIEDAWLRAPNLALNLDHLAILRMAQGDIAGAETAFRNCLQVGSLSPWRYTYDVTGAMIYLAKGDAAQSLYYANQALFRQPKYLGALRYAMAGLALSDKAQDARRMLQRIHVIRPDYDLSDWAEGYLRRTPQHLGSRLVQSLHRNALL